MTRLACEAISGFVGHQHNGVAFLMEPFEKRHDFVTRIGVQRAGRFIGQQNRGLIHQRAGNGDTLPLAAGEFVRLVKHALFQVHRAQRDWRARSARSAEGSPA